MRVTSGSFGRRFESGSSGYRKVAQLVEQKICTLIDLFPILKSTAGSEGNGYFYSDKSVPLPFILRLFYKEQSCVPM